MYVYDANLATVVRSTMLKDIGCSEHVYEFVWGLWGSYVVKNIDKRIYDRFWNLANWGLIVKVLRFSQMWQRHRQGVCVQHSL